MIINNKINEIKNTKLSKYFQETISHRNFEIFLFQYHQLF